MSGSLLVLPETSTRRPIARTRFFYMTAESFVLRGEGDSWKSYNGKSRAPKPVTWNSTTFPGHRKKIQIIRRIEGFRRQQCLHLLQWSERQGGGPAGQLAIEKWEKTIFANPRNLLHHRPGGLPHLRRTLKRDLPGGVPESCKDFFFVPLHLRIVTARNAGLKTVAC